MKNKVIKLILILFVVQACQSSAEKSVERSAELQGPVESPVQAMERGRLQILSSEKLTHEQKIKFLDLIDKTDVDLSEIKKKEGPLKAALFQSFAEGKHDPKELALYFYNIKKLETQKLDLMFSSLVDAGEILDQDRNPEIPLEIMEYYQDALGGIRR